MRICVCMRVYSVGLCDRHESHPTVVSLPRRGLRVADNDVYAAGFALFIIVVGGCMVSLAYGMTGAVYLTSHRTYYVPLAAYGFGHAVLGALVS